MNKLPKIFKKDVSSSHINNKKISYVKKDYTISDSIDVFDKLDKLFKSSRYIFNIKVLIKTKDREYDTKIMSRNRNSILTIDDDLIPIKDIQELIIKDRY